MNQNRPAIVAFVLLIIFVVAGIWLGHAYVAREQQRDISAWGSRLGVIAESQKRAVESWLKMQTSNLQDLTENPLLQILLSIQHEPMNQSTETERGQMAHLQNLIVATARRSGAFAKPEQIKTNQQTRLDEGIAITDDKGGLLLATQQFPPKDDHVRVAVRQAQKEGHAIVYGIYSNDNHEPRLLLAVPVRAVQTNPGAKDYTGAVVAVINPKNNLYKILGQHWLTTDTDETLLVTNDKYSIRYISPLKGRYKIFHTVPRDSKDLAASFAMSRIGDFGLKKDYRGRSVLVTARNIVGTNWVLVQKINASEALRESYAHQRFILTVFTLAVIVIGLAFIAIWRHATSVHLQKTTDSLTASTALLNSVGDNISDHIVLLDKQNNILLGNASLAKTLNVSTENIKGKTLYHLFSADVASSLLAMRSKLDLGATASRVMEIQIADHSQIYDVSATPLQQGEYSGSVLYVLHDITTIKRAQEKHSRFLEGIIATLVRAVDMHDPHCAHHSERTREVAVAVAEAMGLNAERTRALGMAAQLANLGKLNLPRELLTKMQPLNNEEQMQLHRSVLDTINILKGLEFDGPVIDIISQKNEYLDGSGYPEGISGDAILAESRILSVANAFVAMSSARAYRPGKPVNEVLDALLTQADKRYDRHVLAALFHVAENRSDWDRWQVVNES